MRLLSRFVLIFFWLFAVLQPSAAQNSPVSGTAQSADKIAAFTAGMDKQPGFLTFYWDAKKGKIWVEISQFDTEFLYYPTLAQGVGSNDIGLDRGRLGQEHVVSFQRTGNKILMVEPNYNYRAISNDPLEKRAVAESFAQSVHAGFEIVAEEGDGPTNRRALVDFTPFLMQDAVGAAQAITQTKQGNYKLDPARCAMYLPRSKGFPQNTEFEVTITLSGDSPGGYLREVVPTATAVTMRQHHSFVQLPPLDGSYKPRAFDPRIGYGGIEYFDYATPVSQPIMKRYISRHRLQKKDPAASMSEAVKPIVYYMDPGAPEPIRQALMDGIGWWNQAYEAAGFRDAFQVKLLPADADPMDIRYNLVQWVHRSTRGWSYGASIIDPRTGEILKGKVTLGSLRVRQDYLIAQGLIGKFDTDTSHVDEMMQMSLSRLRQLAAHEVGHTLGLPHNYLASTQGKGGSSTGEFGRASVMDYPTMVAKLRGATGPGQTIDLSDAYAKNIGEYDKWSIRYGYTQFADGANEKQELDKLVQDMHRAGLSFLTDQDARPESSAHPQTHLWDNGQNAADELRRVMQVRRVALANFSEKKIPAGTPLTTLEEVLVPLFLFHRYQVEAAVKSVGGQVYTNALRGDGQVVTASVSAAEQNKALDALLESINPVVLSLPDAALKLIPPRAFRYDPNPREVFKRRTGMVFDALAPAETAANLTLRLLLNPERCARLVRQKAIDPTLPGLTDVLDKLRETIVKSPFLIQEGYSSEIARQTEKLLLDHLIRLATNREADGRVREQTHETLLKININYAGKLAPTAYAYRMWVIAQYLNQPDRISGNITSAQPAPDGAPIDPGQEWLLDTECDWKK